MSVSLIASLSDSRLDPYRELKRSNRTRRLDNFIVEGHRVARRLLESPYPVESIVVSDRRRDALAGVVPEHVPLLVVPQELAAELVGYNFHHGVMACGRRLPPPDLKDVLPPADNPALLVVCPHMTDPDNMGGLIRLCAGFGATGLLLGAACCDPFSRRVLRVSMGTAFHVPILEFRDLTGPLDVLRSDYGFRHVATVLDSTATPLARAPRVPRMTLLLGNEADGLAPEWVEKCDERVTIPMAGGTDSLNVTVAAGILLHYYVHPGDSHGSAAMNSSSA
jgi:tRNA G18 (ribose-2'-O)-methylase SpoU